MTNKKDSEFSAASPEVGRISGAQHLEAQASLPNVKAQRWKWLARFVRLCREATAQKVTTTYIRCSAWLGSVDRDSFFISDDCLVNLEYLYYAEKMHFKNHNPDQKPIWKLYFKTEGKTMICPMSDKNFSALKEKMTQK